MTMASPSASALRVTDTGEHDLSRRKDQGRNLGIRDTIYCTGEPFLIEFAVLDLV